MMLDMSRADHAHARAMSIARSRRCAGSVRRQARQNQSLGSEWCLGGILWIGKQTESDLYCTLFAHGSASPVDQVWKRITLCRVRTCDFLRVKQVISKRMSHVISIIRMHMPPNLYQFRPWVSAVGGSRWESLGGRQARRQAVVRRALSKLHARGPGIIRFVVARCSSERGTAPACPMIRPTQTG